MSINGKIELKKSLIKVIEMLKKREQQRIWLNEVMTRRQVVLLQMLLVGIKKLLKDEIV
jgi:hypothetical protein